MLQLPPVNPPGDAPAVASALVTLAKGNAGVLGVHCRGSDQFGSALARAAGADGVAHTISLPHTPAAALAAAGVALCTCAARLTVTEQAGQAASGSSLHTQTGLLAALADAGVTVEWPDPAAEPAAAGDAMRAMRAAGLRVACADLQLALSCGASSVEAILALDAAARSTLLAPAERERLASRVAKDAKALLSAASTALATRRTSTDGSGVLPAASPAPGTAHSLGRRSPSPSPSVGLPPRPRSRASSPSVDAGSLHGYGPGGGDGVTCSLTPSGPGGYPLHWALCRGTPAPMVKLLLASRPGDASIRDAAGRAPLHFAVAAGASAEVVAALIASCPAATDWADTNGETPARLARAMGADHSIMDALMPKTRQQAGQSPLDARVSALSFHDSPAGTPSRDAWRLSSNGAGEESTSSRVPSSQPRAGGEVAFGSPAYGTPARDGGHRTSEAATRHSASQGHAGDDDERCVHDIGAWLDASAPPSHTPLPPAAAPLVARLRQEWGVIDRDSGLGGGKLHRRIQLLRGLSHEAARHACLAPVLGTATRLDPMLPWVGPFGELPAIPQANTVSGSPAQPTWWDRLTAGAGSPTPLPDASTPAAPPCAADVACPECRSAMLRETYLCGRYLVQTRNDSHPLPALCGVSGCAAIMAARDTMAHRTTGGAPEQVVLCFMRDKQAWLLERSARAGITRAVGAVAANTCFTRLLRAHDASGGAASLGDGYDGPSSDTFPDELDARGLGLAPFLLVFELTGPSLDAALTAQRSHLLAARPPVSQSAHTTPVFRSVVVRTDWTAVRVMAWHAATSLAVCHDAGLLHGALCPPHLVASLDGHRWSLTSAAAAVTLTSGGQLMCTPSGVGAARGYVPPEAVMRCEDGSPALRLVERGTAHAWAPATLVAAVSWDIWSFGALVFEASAGVTVLEALSAAEEGGHPGEAALPTPAALHALASWDGSALQAAMRVWHQLVGEDVESSRSAAALVTRCLAPEPGNRPADARELLMSRFLNPLGGRVPTRAADLVSRGGPASAAASPEAGGAAVLIGVARSESPASAREWEPPLSERSASWT